jgi:alanyl-tRNA synthetase
MTTRELRRRFLDFFKKKGHQIVTSSSLLPADPSVLFTTAGMQQFKEYYLEKSSPFGENVATCQKCFRTSDIEEVGDESHLTFLEMLGNFSFGGYFKEEAIKLAYEFLFKELKLLKEEAIFTVFEGDNDVPADEESVLIWKKLGVPKSQIKKCGRDDNFWGPTGEEGPCGPTSEIHLKGTEIWNLVFNEYYQDKDKKLTFLKQKGVDTGMGLERLAMIVQKKNSVFETDLFEPVIKEIPGDFQKARRIIADHVKASVFLISEDILPSNVERGYVLRRVLRRAIRYGKLLNLPKNFLMSLAKKAVDIYKDVYPELKSKEADILTAIQNEEEKFEKTLETGLKELKSQILNVKSREFKVLSGKIIFDLYQSYGFPLDLTRELAREEELDIDEAGFKEEFEKHQEISRAGMEKKFKGGLAGTEKQVIKYHTATHLLLAALREILGQEIYQKGSNITEERLRFDFNYPEKLSEKQLKLIEDLVNEKIRDDIRVEMMELPKSEALKIAKVSFDPSKYGESVKVYKIGDFSIELCGGPHVDKTSELGQFKIVKEESSGAGVRRIRAVLIP